MRYDKRAYHELVGGARQCEKEGTSAVGEVLCTDYEHS